MKLLKLATVLGLVIFSMGSLADIAVIAHPSNTNPLDQTAISKIFLGKVKSYPDGGTIIAINQLEGSPVRAAFDESVLGKSSSQIKSYWSKLMFTGKGTPPQEVQSDAEVKQLVAANPSIIGYVDASLVDDSVKVLLKF